MKKLLLAIALACAPSLLLAQATPVWIPWSSSWTRWDGGAPTGGGGGGGAPTTATYVTQSADATLSAEFSLGSLTTGLLLNTVAGSTGTPSTYAGTSCTNQFPRSLDASGAATCNSVAMADFASTAARTVLMNATNGSAAPTAVAGGGSYTHLVDTGTALKFDRVPYDLTKWSIINQDFFQRSSSAGATVVNNFNISATGTSAGALWTSNAFVGDANHPGMVELTTGTTTTGGATLGSGTATSSTAGGGWLLSGGEILDWLIYVPTASGGTNTFRVYAGFCDTIGNSTCTNGALISWDNNTDTHWAITTIKAGTSTGTLNLASTTTATAAAWHHLKITVDSGATAIHFFVDGSELNNSPLSSNLPTTISTVPVIKIVASAGCASVALCTVDVNTIYAIKPVTR